MEQELPDWIHEGAQVWTKREHGRWSSESAPDPATVVRFTAQRIVVNRRGDEMSFLKDGLRGIGKASDYVLVPEDHASVINAHRKEAVHKAMARLRSLFYDMQLGGRLGWDELPNALEAAELFHEASYQAIEDLEKARERYGEGLRRDDSR